MNNFVQRVFTALLGGVVLLLLLLLSHTTLLAACTVLALGCLWEWQRMRPGSWHFPGVLLILLGWGSLAWLGSQSASWEPMRILPPLFLVWSQDTFAYLGGKLIGRHKLWPRISPGKTWEGMAVGLAATVVVALILATDSRWGMPQPAALVGLVIGLVAVGGDLLESAAKRRAGVKDSSQLLPGHGGLLDRFDALIPVLPVYALWVYLLA